ncbi:tetratricopeptide repeat protein [Paucimonas lemoignei]|uniref:Tetratricopeptide repeat protein n=1 Tax=Paucimonas lemoignei TaxID=29443 RepID=A0A4V2UIU5_PAULE|nr:tetratricopeptide repeat protein [Paucimonas lemoignei]TCS37540.1 tetratricopeptide repeat protein [Paucimonas lemoignei]
MTRRLATLLVPVLLLSGCAAFSGHDDDLYSLRRDAQVAYAGDQDERAEKLLLGVTRAVPNDVEAWFYLGNLYARTNRPDQAAQAYQKALMLNGNDAKVWHNLGVVRLREAWAALIQAYNAGPSDDPLHARLEALISGMEKLPLDGLSRTAKPASPAPAKKQ